VSDERLSTADLVTEEHDETAEARQDADRPVTRDEDGLEPLFASDRAEELRDRWHTLQARFVDDPRETVSEADSLVAELLQELARGFSDARGKLESQWSEGEDVSTEDLRISLKRYRSFFERLLSV
jgi:hypothetical protein